jgi:hypothetical protein
MMAMAVAVVATAGDQGEVTIKLLGGTWEMDRRVRVTRARLDGEIEGWEGPLARWQEAVRLVANG